MDGMQNWKPYLHTSLFSSFPTTVDEGGEGEPFLFPSFRIFSRSTFIGACAFTLFLALLERWLTFLLDNPLHLNSDKEHGWVMGKRKNSLLPPAEGSVYINIPSSSNVAKSRGRGGWWKVVGRTAVYFAATTLRYVLMIITMGMDWALLLSVVTGLTAGHALTDLYKLSKQEHQSEGQKAGEHAGLLAPDEEEAKIEEEGEGDYAGEMRVHKRANSRQQASLSNSTRY